MSKRGRGRPTVGSELRRCPGWTAWEPVRGVWLAARPDYDVLPVLAGRKVTLLAVTARRPLNGIQKWFLTAVEADGEEAYVVEPHTLQLLALVLSDGSSDEAAAAEFTLERESALAIGVEPSPMWNEANQNGIRSTARPYRGMMAAEI